MNVTGDPKHSSRGVGVMFRHAEDVSRKHFSSRVLTGVLNLYEGVRQDGCDGC